MKESEKLVKRWEEEKKKQKTVLYYKNLLAKLSPETIRKMKKVAEIIYEEMNFYSFNDWEPPYVVEIDRNKIENVNLIMSDVEKILKLFTESNYFILPEVPESPEEYLIGSLAVNLPKQNWNTATQDWNFNYPYEQNFKNFLKALNNDIEIKKGETEKPKKIKVENTTLSLNQNGDLYREPKEKHCYPMGEKSNRHGIVRFLATNRGYQHTEFISTKLGIKSEKTIRTEIGKMKSNIEKYLKIDGKDFLQGKKESGYRINPKYKVTFKNE